MLNLRTFPSGVTGPAGGFFMFRLPRGLVQDLRLEFLRLRHRGGFWWLLAISQFVMFIVAVATMYEPLEFFLTKPDGIIPPYFYPLRWLVDASVYSHVCAGLLAVIVFGPDYGAGTYRTLYSRGASRLRVPLVKALLVYLLSVGSWLLWSLIALGFGVHFWSNTSTHGRVLIEVGADLVSFGDVALVFLRSLFALMAYCLFAVAAVSFFRGTALGMASVLLMIFMEYVGFPVFSLILTTLYSYDMSGYYGWAITLALDRFIEWPATSFWDGFGIFASVVGYLAFFCLSIYLCYARRDIPVRS